MAKDIFLTSLSGEVMYLFRIFLACLCGAAIGLERSKRQKEAGIRTHLIVALGSALFMIISKYGFFDVVVYDSVTLDASRVASQVVTGIGFLGAGLIFVKNDFIKGLTTAAGVWATAAIGMAVGCGLYFTAIATTILLIVLQLTMHLLLPSLESSAPKELLITIYDKPDSLKKLKKQLSDWKIVAKSYSVNKHKGGVISVRLMVVHFGDMPIHDTITFVENNPYIKSITL